MTVYYPPCSPEDGEGAPCGYCSLSICCYKHWEEHAKEEHSERLAKDDAHAKELAERLTGSQN